jgi:stress response protein YsnF
VHGRIEVEHVAIGRQVDTMPSAREEGNVTVIPVVDEVLLIEKRLILKEEVHIRRIWVPDVYRKVVTLREQDVMVERTKPGETRRSSALELAPIPKQQALKE